LIITANTTTKKVKKGIRFEFSKSTTTQHWQSQTTREGEIIDIDKLLIAARRVEEQVQGLDRAVTEYQNLKALEKEPEPEDLSARWQTINLVLHCMFILLVFEGRSLTEL
jgi:hypothetical protein